MSGFQVGDVVVCVDASTDRYTGIALLVKGRTYRIRDTHVSPTGETGFCLAGVVHPVPYSTGAERGWYPHRFRKIEQADEQFIVALRACKPERIGEPVNV